MGTSFSNDVTSLRAIAHLFSGREDPTWTLTGPDAERIMLIWRALSPALPNNATAAPLGYRGCAIENAEGERWTAAHEQVVHLSAGTLEARADPDRRFERALLATAPPGLVPDDLIAPEVGRR